ncbi:MAG: hypothetical protein JSU63_19430 [Phycisphaerales bacterium]|nr:MAG: hypothetical protein JSU63_19430 [Phycisphaerales bacterium]
MRSIQLTLSVVALAVSLTAAGPVNAAVYEPVCEALLFPDFADGAQFGVPGITPDACESEGECICIADWDDTFSQARKYRGNVYRMHYESTLTEFRMGLEFLGNANLYFSVHKLDRETNEYVAIWIGPAVRAVGDGTPQFYTSERIEIDGGELIKLEANETYALGVAWGEETITFAREDKDHFQYEFRDFVVVGHVTADVTEDFPPVADELFVFLTSTHAFSAEICLEPVVGACCWVDDSGGTPVGVCSDVLESECLGEEPYSRLEGGYFHGERTTCAEVVCNFGACCLACGDCKGPYTPEACDVEPKSMAHWPGADCLDPQEPDALCPEITGACCDGDVCQELCIEDCDAIGGVYQGDGTGCDPNICVGACCHDDQCDDLTDSVCFRFFGKHVVPGTTCFTSEPGCGGACCSDFGCASGFTRAECTEEQGVPGAVYLGDGVACSGDCPDPAEVVSCCLPDGSCITTTPAFCDEPWVQGKAGALGSSCASTTCTVGACCYGDADCEEITAWSCVKRGGIPEAPGTTCDPLPCTASVLGACCLPDGVCEDLGEEQCSDREGVYQGDATTCGADTCALYGACCLPSGECLENIIEADCIDLGGTAHHDPGATLCVDVECPDNRGACCTKTGTCQFILEDDCLDLAGGATFVGGGCFGLNTCPAGACCLETADGYSCAIRYVDESDPDPLNHVNKCTEDGGFYQGFGTTCDLGRCDLGACCEPDGDIYSCNDEFPIGDCPYTSEFAGVGTTCEEGACEVGVCCGIDGRCTGGKLEIECGASDEFIPGVVCADNMCPAAWACCEADGDCSSLTEAACTEVMTCSSNGAQCGEDDPCVFGYCLQAVSHVGLTCDDDLDMCIRGACCSQDGTCVDGDAGVLPSECTDPNDVFVAEETCGSWCEERNACCRDGKCTIESETDCAVDGGVYFADLAECTAGLCTLGACCHLAGCDDDQVASQCTQDYDDFYPGSSCATLQLQGICVARGACCDPDEECRLISEAECVNSFDGYYGGDAVLCLDTPDACVPGACCMGDETCTELPSQACEYRGGAFLGAGELCGDLSYACETAGTPCATDLECGGVCSTSEVECFADSECDVGICDDGNPCSVSLQSCAGRCNDGTACDVDLNDCDDGSTCTPHQTCVRDETCDPVDRCLPEVCTRGACCKLDGTCVDDSAASQCTEFDLFYPDETCAALDPPCMARGACCNGGQCSIETSADCTAGGGTWDGAGTTCTDDLCVAGACCQFGGTCADLTRQRCEIGAGIYQGAGVDCAAVDCARGSCCQADATCFDDTVVSECVGDLAEFRVGETCASLACEGKGACCVAGSPCETMTESACLAAGGAYQGHEVLCDPDPCPPWGSCCQADGTCVDYTYASECTADLDVFRVGETCTSVACEGRGACCVPGSPCAVLSESDCLTAGGAYQGNTILCDPDPCPAGCPNGPLTWVNPADGVVDARQPRDISDGTVLQGIDAFEVQAPIGADSTCWSVCETLAEGTANEIASVVDDGAGNYTITLNRRITPGAVTKVTYTPVSDPVSAGTFVSLPADSNGDGVSNTSDILSLIDCCLNAVCTPTHGLYSCDIDQSEIVNTADILRLIDLLNGAGQFVKPWNLESEYDGGECP